MWNILNFEISRMVNSRPKRHKVRREDFSATIDYVIFIIRGFPLYTYSMGLSVGLSLQTATIWKVRRSVQCVQKELLGLYQNAIRIVHKQ